MAKTSSTVRTTTIRMNGNPKQKAKSAKKGKPMSEKEKRKAAKA